MAYIASVGLGMPEFDVCSSDLKSMFQTFFKNNRKMNKLLPVFDNAKVKTRQLVKDKQWYGESHTFAETNAAYTDHAIELSLKAIDQCLQEARTGEKRRSEERRV